MDSKYFKTDKVPKGTRIILKESINNIPSTMIIYFKRLKVAGMTIYPLFSSHIQLGVIQVDFSKGLVMEFREEKQEKLFMKRMDKAYEQVIERSKTESFE
ncbi:hypothetical protein ACQUY5_31750 [Bacillus cereus]|uniref:hypothetical protein n=1 Tax=Bacillus cereus TaxID=1396 RepID=UPI003D174125